MKLYKEQYESPLGRIVLTSDGEALTGLWFEGQEHCPEAPGGENANTPAVFEQAKAWLDIYFAGEIPSFTPAVHLEGTPFRMAVWEILTAIPYGETMTYGEIAAMLARQRGIRKMSAQAAGGAVGHNPVSLIVPCHRVIGANGALVGYGGGLDRKAWLLRLEQETVSRFRT